jgi:hypothetical protein
MSKSTDFPSSLPLHHLTSSKPHATPSQASSTIAEKEFLEVDSKQKGKQTLRDHGLDHTFDDPFHRASSSETLLNDLPCTQSAYQPLGQDGNQVMALLRSKTYTQEIYAPDLHHPGRVDKLPQSMESTSKESTKVQVESILDFLKKNYYTDAVYGNLQVDIQEIERDVRDVLEDGQVEDQEERLQKALERLKSIYAHLEG